MKSIGELLKATRQEKGFSLEEVAHETNISKSFIESLENEDFEAFPAEAYLIGFLRNYADYLSLDSNKVISLYRNYKLSESPTPIAELVGKKVSIPWKLIVGILIVLALAGGTVLMIPHIQRFVTERREAKALAEEIRASKIHIVESDFFEAEVFEGDSLHISMGEEDYTFSLQEKNRRLELNAENPSLFEGRESTFFLAQGEEIFISLLGDSPDVRIFAKDFTSGEGICILQVQRLEKPNVEEVVEKPEVLSDITTAVNDVDPPSGASQRKVDTHLIYTAKSPEAFTLYINFKGLVLFRYKSDNAASEQNFYKDGDTFRLDVYRSVKIWGSNAGAVYAKIKEHEIPLGGPGEVMVRQILWVRNDSGTYDLVIVPIY